MVRLSYFAAQEIPAALVTFVSLLMFLQTGTSAALSTLYSALLSMPWLMKESLQRWAVRNGMVRRTCRNRWLNPLLLGELVIVADFLLMAYALNPNHFLFRLFGMGSGSGVGLFAMLLVLSLVTAVHEVLADTYYHTHLRPRLRRLYDLPRFVVSQMAVAGTYGILIILVGTLQVLSRSIFVSWSGACFLMAGIMVLFVVWHVVSTTEVLPSGDVRSPHECAAPPLRGFVQTGKMCGGEVAVRFLLLLFFLPQALMFYSRVLFLLAPREEGGLSRSLQEVGFVHGVIGAFAFCLGLVVSRRFVRRRMQSRGVGRRKVGYSQYALLTDMPSALGRIDLRLLPRFLPLFLSPIVYVLMSYFPPKMLWQIAVGTFLAQFMFGYGMHRLLSYLGLPASVGLRVPLVAASMLVPVAASGWLVSRMGYPAFFLADALTALLVLPVAVRNGARVERS